jgi:hypothetical protein
MTGLVASLGSMVLVAVPEGKTVDKRSAPSGVTDRLMGFAARQRADHVSTRED